MNRQRDARALRAVLEEARAERPPEIDIARIERTLESLPPRSVPRPSLHFGRRLWLVPAAVAALAGLVYLVRPAPISAPVPAPSAASERRGATDGDTLAPGSVVAAADEPRVVAHAGRVTWTLEPGSRATLISAGDMVTVRLERGAVSARVVPSLRPESFAIEARELRVAAHGTAFRVALAADSVNVAVTEGTVLVGPRSQPGTGHLLTSPAAEHFAPPHPGDEPAPKRPSARAPVSTAPSAPEEPSANREGSEAARKSDADTHEPGHVAERPVVPEPSPGAVDTATLHLIELTSACFRQRTVAAQLPSGAAQTTLRYQSLPNGSIAGVQFSPRLPSGVELCVRDGARSLHAPVSPNGLEVSRAIVLSR